MLQQFYVFVFWFVPFFCIFVFVFMHVSCEYDTFWSVGAENVLQRRREQQRSAVLCVFFVLCLFVFIFLYFCICIYAYELRV